MGQEMFITPGNPFKPFFQMKQLLISLLIVLPGLIPAQEYTGSVGVRGGLSSGITFKGFMNEFNAIEAILSHRDEGVQLTILLEKYKPALMSRYENFSIYYGIGAHIGYTKWHQRIEAPEQVYGHPTYSYKRRSSPVLGADGIVGIEYRMDRAPFAFGLDVRPFVELFGEHFVKMKLYDLALSARFTF